MASSKRKKRIIDVLIALFLLLSFYLLFPFLSPIVWAITVAVSAFPVYRWLLARVRYENLAAAIALCIVLTAFFGPIAAITFTAGNELGSNMAMVVDEIRSLGTDGYAWLPSSAQAYVRTALSDLMGLMPGLIAKLFSSGLSIFGVITVTGFLLFFLFRDGERLLDGARSLLPVSDGHVDAIFDTVRDTTMSIFYGRFVIAAIQGLLGGIAFWVLQIPSAFFWGVVMGLVSILPVMGGWIVWLPTSVAFLVEGRYLAATGLIVWGILVISMADNVLFPILVGKRIHMNTPLLFLGILGGISVCGPVGVVLGPLVLSLTKTLIELRKQEGGEPFGAPG